MSTPKLDLDHIPRGYRIIISLVTMPLAAIFSFYLILFIYFQTQFFESALSHQAAYYLNHSDLSFKFDSTNFKSWNKIAINKASIVVKAHDQDAKPFRINMRQSTLSWIYHDQSIIFTFSLSSKKNNMIKAKYKIKALSFLYASFAIDENPWELGSWSVRFNNIDIQQLFTVIEQGAILKHDTIKKMSAKISGRLRYQMLQTANGLSERIKITIRKGKLYYYANEGKKNAKPIKIKRSSFTLYYKDKKFKLTKPLRLASKKFGGVSISGHANYDYTQIQDLMNQRQLPVKSSFHAPWIKMNIRSKPQRSRLFNILNEHWLCPMIQNGRHIAIEGVYQDMQCVEN